MTERSFEWENGETVLHVLGGNVCVDVPITAEHATASGIIVPANAELTATVKVVAMGSDVGSHVRKGDHYIMKRNKGTRISDVFGKGKRELDLRVVPESELLAQVIED